MLQLLWCAGLSVISACDWRLQTWLAASVLSSHSGKEGTSRCRQVSAMQWPYLTAAAGDPTTRTPDTIVSSIVSRPVCLLTAELWQLCSYRLTLRFISERMHAHIMQSDSTLISDSETCTQSSLNAAFLVQHTQFESGNYLGVHCKAECQSALCCSDQIEIQRL